MSGVVTALSTAVGHAEHLKEQTLSVLVTVYPHEMTDVS